MYVHKEQETFADLVGLDVPGAALALALQRALSLVLVHARHEPQPVTGTDALTTPQGAQPPALDAGRVLLQHCQRVAASERQLVRRLGDVVVEGARHYAFLKHTHSFI